MIREKLSKELQLWKGKFFSMGGCKILIKAVAQAMASYVPTSLCLELQALIVKFWWGG